MGRPWAFCVLLSVFALVGLVVCSDECVTPKCATDGPEIRFPFRIRDQPPHCGYPGFEVSCSGNKTVIKLPASSSSFPLTSISYDTQRVHLDPRSCPLDTFLDLNVSTSPFESDKSGETDRYLLLNCSSDFPLASPFNRFLYRSVVPIQCLSGIGHRFFGVQMSWMEYLDESCASAKSETVPRAFIFSLCQGSVYSPSLQWETPDCMACEADGGSCRFKNITSQTITCIGAGGFHVYDPAGGRSKRAKIIGASIGISIFILAVAVTIKLYLSWRFTRNKEIENQRKIEMFLEEYKSFNPTRYSYADVKRFTGQFKTKLGEGGYGSVFKGLLPNGIHVAVKILKGVGNNGAEFVNEVCTIGRIHHVNVVRLVGFCADGVKRALIYEFMPNESLEKFIFSQGQNPSLELTKLREIAIGIARGIEYLHQGCDKRILHFDIKPHNILLDHNLVPKISDFGLAKLCSKEQSIVSMTVARGTVGYIAPEVVSRNFGNVSYKSDVYSFGMLLLEMVGGRKNVDATVDNASQVYFPEWIYGQLNQGLEPQVNIINGEDADIAKLLAITALWCIQWYPVDRPAMKSVLQMLEGTMESLTMPPNPFASAAPLNSDSVNPTKIHHRNSSHLTAISESDTDEAIEI